MNRIIRVVLAAVILAAAAPAAFAQVGAETYTLNASSTNATLLDRSRISWNTRVCARFSLTASCTQAQACAGAVAAGVAVPGGGSCTAAQARTVDIEIFANSQAGRDTYFTQQKALKVIVPQLVAEARLADASATHANYCAGNTAVKDAMCAAAGAPVPASVAAGCALFECPF